MPAWTSSQISGAAGVLSVVPALEDLAYVFGLLQIVWFVWLGVVMLRTIPQPEETSGGR